MTSQEMVSKCCARDGLPDFEKMKSFMARCGKRNFEEDELTMMKQFCKQERKPGREKLQQLMEDCRCPAQQ